MDQQGYLSEHTCTRLTHCITCMHAVCRLPHLPLIQPSCRPVTCGGHCAALGVEQGMPAVISWASLHSITAPCRTTHRTYVRVTTGASNSGHHPNDLRLASCVYFNHDTSTVKTAAQLCCTAQDCDGSTPTVYDSSCGTSFILSVLRLTAALQPLVPAVLHLTPLPMLVLDLPAPPAGAAGCADAEQRAQQQLQVQLMGCPQVCLEAGWLPPAALSHLATCCMMVCRAAVSPGLSSGREYMRSK